MEFFELAPIFFLDSPHLNPLQNSKPFCKLTCSRFSVLVEKGMLVSRYAIAATRSLNYKKQSAKKAIAYLVAIALI
ncbi:MULTISPECIES: hypothetical protein [unclassified Moorena]|uniref:hypothetical protein n=1 Tax=unclassified Moorena TaxID=2683338 RepID=UPI0013B8BDD7|nr:MULTISPECIES: hypothetical protein [unclassified Moorena]NER89322.1 hypothetical protein [Moorena sp. SIO3A2]NES40893.1 hypothetical protein [Moorena sp. SIO2C4]